VFESKNLLTVTAIKQKHLKQIGIVSYEHKVYQQLADDLLAGRVKVRFWLHGKALDTSIGKMWLVEGPEPGQLRIMIPPDPKDMEGNPSAVWEKYKDVPQLFAD